ncbi:GNAT family N-acetyltransferase [Candidatus Micrarchaeota archaeon]|nr:GNAT family N-acetyltransferase [Candidatus Micrarchaeota archaeon]
MSQNHEIITRKACLRDLPEIFNLWKKLISHHQNKSPYFKLKRDAGLIFKKWIKKQIYNKNAQIFVAESKGMPVGYALFTIKKFPPIFVIDRELHLSDIFVLKKYRKKGIGGELIKEGRKWGRKKGLRHSNLEVFAWNSPAIKTYQKSGFKIKRHIMKDY